MKRALFILPGLAVVGGVAIWWLTRGEPAQARERSGQPARHEVPMLRTPLPVDSPHGTLPDVGALPPLPPAHATDKVRSAFDGFAEWLAATYPKADTNFIGLDCSAPPCLVGVRFNVKDMGGAEEIRALNDGVRAEIERRMGFPMAAIHADQDVRGNDYLWMYGLPAELGDADRDLLRRSAELRHTVRMAPLVPPTEAAIPGPGEPGYVEPPPAPPAQP